MTLLDLISVVDEGTNVTVIDAMTDIPLAWYDGKNSIPEKLNNAEVVKIDADNDGINVLINWQ